MKDKRYRLLKDLPGVKAGAIVEPNTYGIPVTPEEAKYSTWPLFYSEGGSCLNAFIPTSYVYNKEWFEEVSEVEDNGLPNDFVTLSNLQFLGQDLYEKKYTQSEVDAIREKTWYDARKLKTDENYSVSFFANYKSYLSSLNLNSNDTGKGKGETITLFEGNRKIYGTTPEQPTNDNAFVDEHFWEQELHKCKINPYYYATKYLTVNGKPFTTRLTETEFNDEFNRGIGNAQSAPEPSALPNKEYEILSFENESGLWKCLADNVYGRCNGDGKYLTTNELLNQSEIHSVRRLS